MRNKLLQSLLVCASVVFLFGGFSTTKISLAAAGSHEVLVEGEDTLSSYENDSTSEMTMCWNYAVYRASQGKKVTVKLGRDVSSYGGSGKITIGSDKYDYKNYHMGTNLKQRSLKWNSGKDAMIDAYQDGAFKVPANCEITLDLNGCKLDRRATSSLGAGQLFLVCGKLVITDSSNEQKGEIRGGYSNGSGRAGGIYVNGGQCILKSGKICGNTADYGGGVYVDGTGCFTMKGGIITANKANKNGGGVYYTETTTPGGCNQKEQHYYSAIHIDGGMITENTAEYGGGIYTNSDGKSYVRSVSIEKNHATKEGGGIYVHSNMFAMVDNVNVKFNYADADYGGGILVNGNYDLSIAGAISVFNNHARTKGLNSNITFEKGARLGVGGLAENSWVGVNTKEKVEYTSVELCRDLSNYDKKYIFLDSCQTALGTTDQVKFEYVEKQKTSSNLQEASVFSNENVVFLLIVPIVVLGILAGVVIDKHFISRKGDVS